MAGIIGLFECIHAAIEGIQMIANGFYCLNLIVFQMFKSFL